MIGHFGIRRAGVGLFGLVAAACSDSSDPMRPSDVVAEVSDSISTVVDVTWTTDEASVGYVEYGPTPEMEFNTPIEVDATREHRQVLLGLTSETKYYFRVVTWDGDDASASDVTTVETGSLPGGLPLLTLTGEGHDQFTIVSTLGMNTAALILDPQGNIVWYHVPEGELDIYRTRLSRDGKSLLYNFANVSGGPVEDSSIVRVALDGSGVSSIPVPLLAHDFVEHEDGTIAAIAVEFRDFEGTEILGNQIVEISPDGEITPVWSAWDCFDPAVHQGEALETGWTFANALDYDPAEDAYYLGMRNFGSITKIDRATGACEWVFGFAATTFDFAPGTELFLHQHQFHLRGNRMLVMDNDGALGPFSRVIEYELDFEASLATQVWSYMSNPGVYTAVLGEPTRLDDGDTFISWSAAGRLERVDPESTSIWQVNLPAGFGFGFNTLAGSLYPPDAPQP